MLLSLWIGRGGSELSAACWMVVAWLLTYTVHAAILASLAALCTRPRRARPVALGGAGRQHELWRLALWLPLLTALGSAAVSGSGHRDLGPGQATASARASDASRASEASLASEASHALLVVTRRPAADWAAEALAGATALALLLGLARFARSARQVSRQLRTRLPARNPRFLQSLGRMSRVSSRASVRLTESDRIDGPMVVGTSEICLPADGMPVLADAELDAVLAHELAHLERRDGLWVPLTALLRECLWFHPLTRWVSSRVAETAELACDDRAVSLVSDPAILARALAQVAAAAADGARKEARKGAGNEASKEAKEDGSWSLLPAMASPRSKLFVRVQRLAQPERRPAPVGRPRRERALTMALSCVSLACLGVAVRSAPNVHAAPAAGPRAEVAADGAPEPASLEANMTQLFVEESRVSGRLAETLARFASLGAAAEERSAVIELRQELSHIHQMQAWLEGRLAKSVSPSSTTKSSSSASISISTSPSASTAAPAPASSRPSS